jgi:hypothetical protein
VPEAKYFCQFDSTIVHSDGSTFTLRSTLPTVSRIDLVKDTLQHILWNPSRQNSALDQSSEEYRKFQKKFQNELDATDLADLAFDETANRPEMIVSSSQGGKRKKK